MINWKREIILKNCKGGEEKQIRETNMHIASGLNS